MMLFPSNRTTKLSVAIMLLALTTGCGNFDKSSASALRDYDWRSYGGSLASDKYAPLTQINRDNIEQLKVVWTWDSPDNAEIAADPTHMPLAYKSTPIKIGRVLYTNTSLGLVAAIDATTGEQLWQFDTDTRADGRPTNLGFNSRGVSSWQQGDKHRILTGTNNGYLWSLHADTGLPDKDFGDGGKIDLTVGLGREVPRKFYSSTAAPMIVGNTVVMGSIVADYPVFNLPPGHVRGFDVESGDQQWIFNAIPKPGETGNNSWENDSWREAGAANVWTSMSADLETGYVYLPFGTPNNDWYGGHRLGDNLFAESLVCLDAATGNMVWYYQMVHHGLWDYDLPAAPNLVDITVDGTAIKAVAQISKQGFIYVLDRLTGEPVWPIEERAVAQSTVPGERSSPTQPFPTRPAPFEQQGISDATLIDYTPELRAKALALISHYDYGELFTPPSLRGTVQLPGWAGGANWMGAAVDPETAMIYIPSNSGAIVTQLVKPKKDMAKNFAKMGIELGASKQVYDYVRGGAQRIRGPERLPLVKPPYGRISAIDLNSGDYRWVKANAEGIRQKLIDKGIADPGPVGTFNMTGPLLTKTLLISVVSDNGKHWLRAVDKQSGELLHQMELPGRPSATPMSYMVDGRQYISVALGGMKKAQLVALALP
ncbi:MAG: quinoprotein glucose dehydrogenase [Paraglaciecola psychrophila]|jgi:quinoprotein glucose dehydrogenase